MSNKRNKFTDALNEEITAREILTKARTTRVKSEIFLSENVSNEGNKPAENVVTESKLTENIFIESKPEENVVAEKKVPKKIVITKADFEKRVMAEAENDFYDEVEFKNIGEHMRSKVADTKNAAPVFHSKYLDNTVSESEEKKSEDFEENLKVNLTRAEIAGMVISIILLVYSFATMDKPLFFFALSLVSNLSRPIVGAFFGKYNRAVQNAMRSFSLVLFFGALLFTFMH